MIRLVSERDELNEDLSATRLELDSRAPQPADAETTATLKADLHPDALMAASQEEDIPMTPGTADDQPAAAANPRAQMATGSSAGAGSQRRMSCHSCKIGTDPSWGTWRRTA